MSETDSVSTTRRLRTSWGKSLPSTKVETQHQHAEPWYKVMCLTGVDYFSTLGYQPGIAYVAAGALAPMATLVLVLVTLFGALPAYNYVAGRSPHGEGSISMLQALLSRWKGKLLVLCLLGFAATSFIITITLSAADAAAHLAENPYLRAHIEHHRVELTLGLVITLGLVFWRGFGEAINIAVALVVSYLALNLVTIFVGFQHIAQHPELVQQWLGQVHAQHPNWGAVWLAAMLLFPKLALGLSGFETGVAVMPLVRGEANDDPKIPAGRIRNARKLLTCVALIMSAYLIGSSLVTSILIPAAEFERGGNANGRALAFLTHQYLGHQMGTLYDVVTILILWFAGASALVGLLTLVPRYLPRYGMAPEWARERRPLVVVFTLIGCLVTVLFEADVDSQGGAYATGVLALICSAALAVALDAVRSDQRRAAAFYSVITLVFVYTLGLNIIERPDGLKIAGCFIGAMVGTSFYSRLYRSTELRVESIEFDELAHQFITANPGRPIRLIANRRDVGDLQEYRQKEQEQREFNHIPPEDEILFLEVKVGDASDFGHGIVVRGVEVGPYRVLRTECPAVSNAIAAILLHIRDLTGTVPHAYFGWKEGNPALFLLGYLAFGEGDIAPLTREVLRRAEKDPYNRPRIHVA